MREDLGAAGMNSCHPDRIFDGIGTTVGEEDFVQPGASSCRDPLGRFTAGLVRMLGGNRREQACLRLDCGNHFRVLKADIGENQL